MKRQSYSDYYDPSGEQKNSSAIVPLPIRIARVLKLGDRIKAAYEYRRETGYPLQQCMDFITSLSNGFQITNEGGPVVDQAIQIDIPDYVKRVQDIAAETLKKPSGTNPERETVVELLKKYPSDLVIWMLGDFGKHLLAFANMVTESHPSISDINSGTLVEGGVVYKRVKEQMRVAQIARDEKFTEMPPAWNRWFNRNHKSIDKVLLKPPVRFLKSAEKRREFRKASQPKDIDLTSIYEKGRRDTWDMLPDDFVPYTRMGPGFRKEIEYYHRMEDHLKKLGMPHYAKVLDGDVVKFGDILAEQHMGFIRIKMTDVAMIAAKAMGGKWGDEDRLARIYIAASHFTRAFWSNDPKGKLQSEPMLSDVFDKHVTLDTNYRQSNGTELKLVLTPRVYPIDRFGVTRPENVTKMLDALDSHVDANGNSLFDNYWVVVPGVTVNTGTSDTFQFSDNEQTYKFIDYWDYATALDLYLTQQGQIFPVLIGELVNRRSCYFLGYYC